MRGETTMNIYGTSGALVNDDQPLLLDGTAVIGVAENLVLVRLGPILGTNPP